MTPLTTLRRDGVEHSTLIRVSTLLCLWLMLLLVYAVTTSLAGVNTDANANSMSAWRIATTGQPWMDGLDLTEPGRVHHFVPGRDGHSITTATPGPKLAAVPFYIGADGSQRSFSYVPGSLAAAFWTAVAMALLYASLAGLVSRLHALYVTGVVALATPVWSVSANALWTHPVDLLGLSAATLALRKDRFWLAGLGFALAELGRPHVALIAAVVGCTLALNTRTVRPLVQIGTGSALGLFLLAAWSAYNTGYWSVLGGYTKSLDSMGYAKASTFEGAVGFLVSPSRGLLIWTPLAIVIVVLVIHRWQETPLWTRALILGGCSYTTLQVYVNPYGGDGFWGYRHGLELVICAAPVAAVVTKSLPRATRKLIGVIAAVQFALMATGSVFDELTLLGPQYGDEWSANPLGLALAGDPMKYGTFTAACLGLGLVVGLRLASTPHHPMARERVPAQGHS